MHNVKANATDSIMTSFWHNLPEEILAMSQVKLYFHNNFLKLSGKYSVCWTLQNILYLRSTAQCQALTGGLSPAWILYKSF